MWPSRQYYYPDHMLQLQKSTRGKVPFNFEIWQTASEYDLTLICFVMPSFPLTCHMSPEVDTILWTACLNYRSLQAKIPSNFQHLAERM